jgi:hypothetical protein
MAPGQIKALELRSIAMVQGENLVLDLGSTQHYSRQRCMPLRHVQLRIYIGTIKIETYTGCPRRNVPYFGRVFLMLKYTDITQNTYVQS